MTLCGSARNHHGAVRGLWMIFLMVWLASVIVTLWLIGYGLRMSVAWAWTELIGLKERGE
jgi:hypothetical protein